MTTLFSVIGSQATPLHEVTLNDLRLGERAHLQEWVLAYPEVLGDDVLIITSEYDKWAGADGVSARDRLDVLGLDASGRLVVVELKRGDAPRDVHLQVVTYGALVSRFTLDTLADALAHFRSRRGRATTFQEAKRVILEHTGGAVDPDLMRRPRLVLVAGDFPRQVTHTAVWLSEMGVDIALVKVTAWRVGDQVLAGFTKIYPTPELEEFTLAPTRAESSQVVKKAEEQGRVASAVRRLIDAAVIPDGSSLRLEPDRTISSEALAQVDKWLSAEPTRGQAVWRNDPVAPIVWGGDGQVWKPAALGRHILGESGSSDASSHGLEWWVTQDGTDLATLAGAASRQPRDWSDLHGVLEAIPPGRWTTYGDLAAVIGTAAQPVGTHIARCNQCENAHRVLAGSGRTAENFAWDDPERTDTPEEMLTAEGVPFQNGVASADHRLTRDELRELIPSVD